MLAVNVAGGTDAGKRRVKVLPPWECDCNHPDGSLDAVARLEHPGHHYSCPDCGRTRP